ncbi:barstar family protein [Micromonospora aurantiaca (nom. illeg.)]|uniref:barstar family protein n=1 Tax=Micromonospora aurantiaca (nom. illeg.) TaxID=47850 RepID=UPI003EC0FAA7
MEIDGRKVRTEADLHQFLARALDFGPYYGANLDALWDRLSMGVPRPVVVVWTDWQVSERNLGAERFERIRGLLRAVEAEDREAGHEERFTFELDDLFVPKEPPAVDELRQRQG